MGCPQCYVFGLTAANALGTMAINYFSIGQKYQPSVRFTSNLFGAGVVYGFGSCVIDATGGYDVLKAAASAGAAWELATKTIIPSWAAPGKTFATKIAPTIVAFTGGILYNTMSEYLDFGSYGSWIEAGANGVFGRVTAIATYMVTNSITFGKSQYIYDRIGVENSASAGHYGAFLGFVYSLPKLLGTNGVELDLDFDISKAYDSVSKLLGLDEIQPDTEAL